MERFKRTWSSPTFTAVLALACVGLIVLAIAQQRRMVGLRNQVDASYQKSFFEMGELMSSMQVNLEKLMVTADGAQEQKLLATISRQAEGAQQNLAMLPSQHEAVVGAQKFVNQVNDYSRTLQEHLAGGGALSAQDQKQLANLYAVCSGLNGQILEMTQKLISGANLFDGMLGFHAAAAMTDQTLGSGGDLPAAEYPVLLYDGPFSDGRDGGVLRAVTGEDMDEQAAMQRAVDFIGRDRVRQIRQVGKNELPAPSYEFEATVENGNVLSLSVTQQGAHVLYMLSEQGAFAETLTPGACADIAQTFLQQRGFREMKPSYWQKSDGILTMNFAATQQDVVLYPDLVKLQVSMSDGHVLGIEAQNYFRNHVPRENLTPLLTQEQARWRLNPTLSVEGAQLCVIPLEAGEALCYEFVTRLMQARYLVYVDANTGQERTIFKLVEEENGQLTV